MDWSIQDIARLAGTTSRTLRHYDDVGVLKPTRIGSNGYRYYDERALVRLQRILMLRDLGLGIPAVAEVLAGAADDSRALLTHLRWLQREKERIDRQIASVESTIFTLESKDQLMAENMFDGFDHAQHKSEVVERWGKAAYADSDTWWREKSAIDRKHFAATSKQLTEDWTDAAASRVAPNSVEAQTLARRQYDWLSAIPGTPQTAEGRPTKEYFLGLAEMYVADPRFAANYGGLEGAAFVRDAMVAFAGQLAE